MEEQRCTKLGPGRLGALMETHNSEFIIYRGKMRWSSSSWGRGCDTVILWNRRNL
jgi:hypothetical protein